MGFMVGLGKTKSDIGSTGRLKVYPDGTRELLVCDKPIFTGGGWERSGWDDIPSPRKAKDLESSNECSSERALRRARAQVRDLALCTPFRYFVTLTLDKSKIDRYDMAEITRRLNVWLDNRVRRKGLAYVLVPEYHKDGAIHFHGFFNDALRAVDSGRCDSRGHSVFNLPDWTYGFTTAIELYGDYHAAVSYVCKYIGKGSTKIGGRWYYSGGQLGRPIVEYVDISIRDVEAEEGAYSFQISEAGLSFALLRLKAEEKPAENSGLILGN